MSVSKSIKPCEHKIRLGFKRSFDSLSFPKARLIIHLSFLTSLTSLCLKLRSDKGQVTCLSNRLRQFSIMNILIVSTLCIVPNKNSVLIYCMTKLFYLRFICQRTSLCLPTFLSPVHLLHFVSGSPLICLSPQQSLHSSMLTHGSSGSNTELPPSDFQKSALGDVNQFIHSAENQ